MIIFVPCLILSYIQNFENYFFRIFVVYNNQLVSIIIYKNFGKISSPHYSEGVTLEHKLQETALSRSWAVDHFKHPDLEICNFCFIQINRVSSMSK